ncbi:EamA family transporter RarD [Aciduricibacillus chroicocephali]|uniref:EamA family transporter RarD n=1 Tax=Aciduricibacillus chroicocephali TaxID=3054939 RepID=A0ABY9KU51_9BACI|nr:EamA family transporter RarD [Bacillaceae bacterium 44XB]
MERNTNMNYGILITFISYIIWGLLPLYWKLLGDVSPDQILAARIVWSFVFMLIALTVSGGWKKFTTEARMLLHDKRNLAKIVIAAFVITLNWLTYIWAVNTEHVIQASLGYYINPLVSILLGIVILKESLTRRQTAAVILAVVGVLYMAFDFGKFPWISLVLAFSFGIYGLLKKTVNLSAMTGLTIETLVVTPIALIYLWLAPTSSGFTFTELTERDLLLIGTGIATAVPLLLFATGAKHIPLALIGFIQYVAPTLMLLLGVFLYHEPFTRAHAVAFALIWAALFLYMSSLMRGRKRRKQN